MFWIAKYAYRVQDAEALVGVGLFSEQELRLFRRCETFLWKVRCTMHFATGRPEERLSFDLQRVIAKKLGYSERDGLSAVERFMKHYFVIAKHVGDLTNIVCAGLEERQAKPRAVFDRFVGRFRRRGKPKDLGPFSLETDRVTVAGKDVFDREPINLIRLFRSPRAMSCPSTRMRCGSSPSRCRASTRNCAPIPKPTGCFSRFSPRRNQASGRCG